MLVTEYLLVNQIHNMIHSMYQNNQSVIFSLHHHPLLLLQHEKEQGAVHVSQSTSHSLFTSAVGWHLLKSECWFNSFAFFLRSSPYLWISRAHLNRCLLTVNRQATVSNSLSKSSTNLGVGLLAVDHNSLRLWTALPLPTISTPSSLYHMNNPSSFILSLHLTSEVPMLHLLLYASPCFHDPMWILQQSEYHDWIPSHVSKEPRRHDHYHSFLLLLQIQPINSISPSFSQWIAILLPYLIVQSHDLPSLEIPDDPKCVHNIF